MHGVLFVSYIYFAVEVAINLKKMSVGGAKPWL